MAAYMRARRAHQKAEREGEPVVDVAIPRGALLKENEHELAAVWAKAAAIGPGAVITKTGGPLDVLNREAFEARRSEVAHNEPPTPAPRSMIAVGGRPADHSGFGSVATETAAFRANVTASLNRLAQEAVEAKREREAQERRIAALEAAANRRADAADIVQAVFGLFNYVVRHSPVGVRRAAS